MARICLLVVAMLMTGVMERCCAIDEEYYLGDYYDYDNDYDYSGPNPGKKIYKFTNFPYCILIFLCGQARYRSVLLRCL